MEEHENYYCGSAKQTDEGLTLELNLTKLEELLKKPSVSLTLKTFAGKGGAEQTAVMLQVTKLKPEECNKYRTHSVRVNVKYRQGL